jgi:hypothetical protein
LHTKPIAERRAKDRRTERQINAQQFGPEGALRIVSLAPSLMGMVFCEVILIPKVGKSPRDEIDADDLSDRS